MEHITLHNSLHQKMKKTEFKRAINGNRCEPIIAWLLKMSCGKQRTQLPAENHLRSLLSGKFVEVEC